MLIGLTGPAGSGKTTCARILCERGFIEIAFADPIKDMLSVIFHIKRFHEDKESIIDYVGKSGRELMQSLGTDWGRNMVGVDMWVNVAEQRLNAIGNHRSVVVSDVRFENEAAMIRRRGGTILRIFRDGVGLFRHASEDGITVCNDDIAIDNSGHLGYTRDQLSNALLFLSER